MYIQVVHAYRLNVLNDLKIVISLFTISIMCKYSVVLDIISIMSKYNVVLFIKAIMSKYCVVYLSWNL